MWDSLCDSVWSCSPWEECANGVSKRTCEDRNKCFVSTEVPDTVRYCDGTCVEDWECKWSSCSNGFTTPDCSDLNRCGTKFDEPQELECNSGNSCIPHIVCEAWSECSVDYNFLDLIGEEITEVTGTKRRICKDLSLCSESISETRECSVGVDIYTKKINKCGTEYVGVYNKLNNELIARIEQGTNNNPFLNLYLDYNEEGIYCDYCFDGVMNGDEEEVDCGGGCRVCEEKYKSTDFEKLNFTKRFIRWVKRMIT